MDFATIFMVAILTEALIEYAKTIGKMVINKEYKTFGAQAASIVIGIVVAFQLGANVFPQLGLTANTVFGTLVTGLIFSRGSNYVSDLLSRLTK